MSKRKGGRKRASPTPFSNAVETNAVAFSHYYNYLWGLTVNSIIWENLPDTVNKRLLEVTITNSGRAVFFEDEVIGYLGMPCTVSGEVNVNQIPINRRAYSSNGYNKDLTIDDSVIIYNNYMRIPDINTVRWFASRLVNCSRCADVNINNQKFPLAVLCSEQQRLSMVNVYNQYEGNAPVIFGTKDMDVEGIKCIKTGVPFVADKLIYTEHQIMNEFLTWLGAENSNQDKKERLVADEVGSNYGNVELSRNMRLNARLEACDEINRMFGLNVNCRFNSNINTMLNIANERIYSYLSTGGGMAYGNLHNDDTVNSGVLDS